MNLYAVAIRDYKILFIEFYWAENEDHAIEQAIDAYPSSRHEAVVIVPYIDPR